MSHLLRISTSLYSVLKLNRTEFSVLVTKTLFCGGQFIQSYSHALSKNFWPCIFLANTILLNFCIEVGKAQQLGEDCYSEPKEEAHHDHEVQYFQGLHVQDFACSIAVMVVNENIVILVADKRPTENCHLWRNLLE